MITLTIFDAASQDLVEIEKWYGEAGNNPVGMRILRRLLGKFEFLMKHPKMGRLRPELGMEVRSSLVKPSLIFYRLAESEIQVLRVPHHRRDIRGSMFAE